MNSLSFGSQAGKIVKVGNLKREAIQLVPHIKQVQGN